MRLSDSSASPDHSTSVLLSSPVLFNIADKETSPRSQEKKKQNQSKTNRAQISARSQFEQRSAFLLFVFFWDFLYASIRIHTNDQTPGRTTVRHSDAKSH